MADRKGAEEKRKTKNRNSKVSSADVGRDCAVAVQPDDKNRNNNSKYRDRRGPARQNSTSSDRRFIQPVRPHIFILSRKSTERLN